MNPLEGDQNTLLAVFLLSFCTRVLFTSQREYMISWEVHHFLVFYYFSGLFKAESAFKRVLSKTNIPHLRRTLGSNGVTNNEAVKRNSTTDWADVLKQLSDIFLQFFHPLCCKFWKFLYIVWTSLWCIVCIRSGKYLLECVVGCLWGVCVTSHCFPC